MAMINNQKKKIDYRPFSEQLLSGLREVAQKSKNEYIRKRKKVF